ncbi:LINE-1 reverse transcriptase-like [Vitis vinifera]|uniref:LINE-1 reverse transcriptase-like n=1 Tax=Vitis vinifera TaxID=29760 RepID=A0A438DW67_VITVI|nr:LINE-1 reverse transcriptase-like [Vitis vinifera]
MKLRILSWNVRGANDKEKRRVIKDVIKSQKVDLVCIQETKIQEMSNGLVKSLGVGRCLEWGSLNSRGTAGGVLVFWDNRVLQLEEMEVGKFTVSCRFKSCEDGFCWCFTGVYGPTAKVEREDFWSELGAIKGLWNEPWCVAGDFNMIRFPSERSRGGRLTQAMRRFSEVVEKLELRDLPLQGGVFTWCGGLNNRSKSRIDRFFISEDWETHFQGAIQTVLARPISDHTPILLDGGGMRRGPTPFRFENMWLKSEGFKEVMRQWWEGIQVNGSASFILTEKLKALKPLLRSWNKEVFGQIDLEKQKAWNLIEYWDKEEMVRSLSIEEEEVRKEARELYKKWALLEEVSWRQKSREIWLKEGDRNTKFFHKMANAHRRRKQLNRIKVNERCFTGESEIKEEVGRNFQELLTDPGDWKPSIEGLNFERLEEREVERLEQPFSEEEVFEALKGCCGEKAPRPDGFSMAFWQFAWDFVKVEVLNLFRQFHETGRFVRSMNATFLVLIPKKGGAEDLKDFRPISLVGGFTNVLIANEAIDFILKNNRGAIMCKLDIEKAYDHVDWKFLIAVMGKMGFGELEGIRQGDPLSPYLFVIVMEAFSCLMKRAVDGGFLTPCLVRGRRGEGVQITHLLFADDTLVFCEAKEDQLTHLCWLLMWFEALSGLKVNMEKSELIPVGRVENVGELADEFGYKVGNLPSTYLGMPLGAPFKSSGVWDGIEERFKRRLAMWKRQYISKGGRITLIRSTLSNLSIYFMSIFQIPRAVRIRLEKIQRDFLWGGGALEQKPHLALLGKWAWRFANEKTALWNQVIRRKYGEEKGGWRSCEIREAYGVGLWKAINKVGQFVTPFFGYEVGDGKNVRFWKDKWCGTSPLREAFPSLFSIATSKEAWVNEVWTAEGDRRGSWTPTFNRPFNDWELEEVGRLLRCLEGKMVRVDEEDRVRWVESKDGVFSVKSLYRVMQPVSSAWFPSKIIWMSYAQPKISFFVWEASWGRVLTLDRLQKRGWALANRLERFHYGQEEEGDVAFGTVMLVLGSFGRLEIQLLLRTGCYLYKS